MEVLASKGLICNQKITGLQGKEAYKGIKLNVGHTRNLLKSAGKDKLTDEQINKVIRGDGVKMDTIGDMENRLVSTKTPYVYN